ncbi:MAG: N-acetylmuramoyl-L-alanine amidase [Chthoniobacterales bacterium]
MRKKVTHHLLPIAHYVTSAILCSLALLLSGCALFENGSSLSNCHTVVVDPGHGGYDHGAHAVRGQDEKMLTMDTALRLKPLLQARGYHVIMTRSSDVFIPLGGRTALANAHPDALFVSIHYNCSPRHAASGIETYYYNRSSIRLADAVFRELIPVYGGHPRGVKQACYYVLHHNHRPAVLLELGFISNSHENAILQDPSTRQRLAEHIAAGIAKAQRR